MKAAVLVELGKLSLMDLHPTEDLGVGQVLVRVYAAGICGAQLGEIAGAKGPDPYLPHLLGHEGAGRVEGVGPGVKTVKVDDHVVLHWRKGSGIEAECAKYSSSNGFVGGGLVHTFCEMAVVSENRVTVIDKDIPFEIAALMGCAVTTGFGVINNEAKLKIGQDIMVIGCGGVGLSVIIAASLAGASDIWVMDTNVAAQELALELVGPTTSPIKQISDSLPTRWDASLFDIVVDCTGVPSAIEDALNHVVPGGKLILVGQPHHNDDLVLRKFRKHYCGKNILISDGGLTNPAEDIPRYLEMYKNGRLPLDKLITHYTTLPGIDKALEMMRGTHPGRIIVRMNDDK